MARLGGDEFALVIADVTDPERAIEIVHELNVEMQRPIKMDGLTLAVTASAGIAMAPEHGDDAALLLQRADIAMYVAKERRSTVEVYSVEHDQSMQRWLMLGGLLTHALETGTELSLMYQPIGDVQSRDIAYVEALCRWNHPVQGFIPPEEFIGIAEQMGLIPQITDFVLNEGCAQLARWREAGITIGLAVNVSGREFADINLVDRVETCLRRYDIPAHLLTLEVTETEIMADLGAATKVLYELSARGIKLGIDDYGTGYSSLQYLHKLPVNELKIDRSFVTNLPNEASNRIIVRSSIQMAHSLGLYVIAEGAEDELTCAMLAEAECDFIQGYYLSKPQKADDLQEWILGGAKLEFAPDRWRSRAPRVRRSCSCPSPADRRDPPGRACRTRAASGRPRCIGQNGAVRPTVTGPRGRERPALLSRVAPSRVHGRDRRAPPSALVATAGPIGRRRHSGPPAGTRPQYTGPLAPVVRPGQPYVTPGHAATTGPIGANPSDVAWHPAQRAERPPQRSADLQRRLRRPLRPGRRSLGLRLCHQHDRLRHDAAGAHPGHRRHAGHRVRRPLPGRRPADPARHGPWRATSGPRRSGPARRDVRHVLLDPGDPAARLRLQGDHARLRADDARGEHGHVHLPGHQHQPGGALRRRLERRPSSAPRHRAAPSTPASSSPRTARRGFFGRPTATAATCRRTSTPSSCRPTASRPSGRRTSSSAPRNPGKAASSRHPRWSNRAPTFWMFYSANLWGTPNYSIGIAKCQSVTGPCTKPLDQAWHTSTNSANGQGYGGSEFFEPAGDSSGWCTTASCRDSRATTPNGASTST